MVALFCSQVTQFPTLHLYIHHILYSNYPDTLAFSPLRTGLNFWKFVNQISHFYPANLITLELGHAANIRKATSNLTPIDKRLSRRGTRLNPNSSNLARLQRVTCSS
jgi:hypothetical protein